MASPWHGFSATGSGITIADEIVTLDKVSAGPSCIYAIKVPVRGGDYIEFEVAARWISGDFAAIFMDFPVLATQLARADLNAPDEWGYYRIAGRIPLSCQSGEVIVGVGVASANIGSAAAQLPIIKVNGAPIFRSLGYLTDDKFRVTANGTVIVGDALSAADPFVADENGLSFSDVGHAGRIKSYRKDTINNALWGRKTSGEVHTFYCDTLLKVGSIGVNSTSTSYNTSSDYRLKESIEDYGHAGAVIDAMRPVRFTWKLDGRQGFGFIAHELQAVIPEAVTGEKDALDADGAPEYQGVDMSKLVPLLVAEVQELRKRLATVESRT